MRKLSFKWENSFILAKEIPALLECGNFLILLDLQIIYYPFFLFLPVAEDFQAASVCFSLCLRIYGSAVRPGSNLKHQ